MCHTPLLPIRVYGSRYRFFFYLDLDLGAGVTFSRLKGFLEEVHAPYLFLLLDFGFLDFAF